MRVKRGTVSHRKHKKLLKSVSGYRMSKHRLVKAAKEAALHAGQYAYAGRKQKKSNFRKLWVTRIAEAVRQSGLTYSQFIPKMKKAQILLDRKILAHFVVSEPVVFQQIVDKVKNI